MFTIPLFWHHQAPQRLPGQATRPDQCLPGRLPDWPARGLWSSHGPAAPAAPPWQGPRAGQARGRVTETLVQTCAAKAAATGSACDGWRSKLCLQSLVKHSVSAYTLVSVGQGHGALCRWWMQPSVSQSSTCWKAASQSTQSRGTTGRLLALPYQVRLPSTACHMEELDELHTA